MARHPHDIELVLRVCSSTGSSQLVLVDGGREIVTVDEVVLDPVSGECAPLSGESIQGLVNREAEVRWDQTRLRELRARFAELSGPGSQFSVYQALKLVLLRARSSDDGNRMNADLAVELIDTVLTALPPLREELKTRGEVDDTRVVLRLHEPSVCDLAWLPWESWPDRDLFRYERRVVQREAKHPTSGHPRVLAVVGDVRTPEDAPSFHRQVFLDDVRASLGDLSAALGESLTVVSAACHRSDLARKEHSASWPVPGSFSSPGELLDSLRATSIEDRSGGRGYDVIVFYGHGVRRGNPSNLPSIEGADALACGWQGDPELPDGHLPIRTEAENEPDLLSMLAGTRTRGVVLAACNVQDAFAQQLLAAVDHVVGMRCELTTDAARVVLATIFETLGAPERPALGEAVRIARDALVGKKLDGQAPFLAHWSATRTDLHFTTELELLKAEVRSRMAAFLKRVGDEDPIGRPHTARDADVVVQLAIDPNAELPRSTPDRQDELEHRLGSTVAHEQSLWELVRVEQLGGRIASSGRRLVVRGVPGSGKSTTLRDVAQRLDDPGHIGEPLGIFVSLPDWRSWLSERSQRPNSTSLAGYVASTLDLGDRDAELANVFARSRATASLVLLFDGYDEVASHPHFTDYLNQVADGHEGPTVVVTTRIESYDGKLTSYDDARLLPLRESGQVELLARVYLAAIESGAEGSDALRARLGGGTPELENLEGLAEADLVELRSKGGSLQELATIPLFLSHLGWMAVVEGSLPEGSRHELLKQMIEFLLGDRHRPLKDRSRVEPRESALRLLQRLAYELTKCSQLGRSRARVEHLLARIDPKSLILDGFGGSSTFLDQLRHTGLFGPFRAARSDSPKAEWRFRHRAFQEELTALEIAKLELQDDQGLFERLLADVLAGVAESDLLEYWREPFALAAGHLDDANSWARLLLTNERTRRIAIEAAAVADSLGLETLQMILEQCSNEERKALWSRLGSRGSRFEVCLNLARYRLKQAPVWDWELYPIDEVLAWIEEHGTSRDLRAEAGRIRRQELYGDREGKGHFARLTPDLFRHLFLTFPRRNEPEWVWVDTVRTPFMMGQGDGIRQGGVKRGMGAPFAMMRTTVTCAMFEASGRSFLWRHEGDDLPAHGIGWVRAELFSRWLTREVMRLWDDLTPSDVEALAWPDPEPPLFRLPTESEWEWSCRGGTQGFVEGPFNVEGITDESLENIAWYKKNSNGHVHAVGAPGKRSNSLGIHDMHGNVWEWCQDWNGDLRDGTDRPRYSGRYRVRRGGSCICDPDWCRTAFRFLPWYRPNLSVDWYGFRLVASASPRPL